MSTATATNIYSHARELLIEGLAVTGYTLLRQEPGENVEGLQLPYVVVSTFASTFELTTSEAGRSFPGETQKVRYMLNGRYLIPEDPTWQGLAADAGGELIQTLSICLLRLPQVFEQRFTAMSSDTVPVPTLVAIVEDVDIDTTSFGTDENGNHIFVVLGSVNYAVAYQQ